MLQAYKKNLQQDFFSLNGGFLRLIGDFIFTDYLKRD